MAALAGFAIAMSTTSPRLDPARQNQARTARTTEAERLADFLTHIAKGDQLANKQQTTWRLLHTWGAVLQNRQRWQHMSWPDKLMAYIPHATRQQRQALAKRTLALWRAGAFDVNPQPAPEWPPLATETQLILSDLPQLAGQSVEPPEHQSTAGGQP